MTTLGTRGVVAPYLGAWIEIYVEEGHQQKARVAPYLGAWIEITYTTSEGASVTTSHPTWVRGLKYLDQKHMAQSLYRRTLPGCVD